MTKAIWRALKDLYTDGAFTTSLQNVYTPPDVCYPMITETLRCIGNISDETFLLQTLGVLECLHERGVNLKNVWFVTDSPEKEMFASMPRYNGVNVIRTDYLTWRPNMKFDVICGNPPYQASQDREEKGRGRSGATLWNQFVLKSIELCKDNGYICLVHPAKWRKPDDDLNSTMRNKNITYLEIHDHQDGVKIFGCQTRYDWYVMQNSPSKGKTTVRGQDGVTTEMDLRNSPVIPNAMIDEIMSLIAGPNDEKIQILYSRSAYGSDKPHMSKEKKGEFQHPCLYSINVKGEPTFWYSSIKNNGHFGIPKVIFPSGHYGSVDILVDEKGEYGLTQFGRGVVDSPKVLPMIAAAMRTEKFKKMAMAIATSTTELDKVVFSYFRKDFWKHFVDENGNVVK